MQLPETRYTQSDDSYIGYQIWGHGGVDLIEFAHAANFSIDETANEPRWLRYERRLATFSRLVRFDPSGIGLSAGTFDVDHGFDAWVDDAVAVLDAVGVQKTAVIAGLVGSFSAVLFANRHPERVSSLVLLNGTARLFEASDYPVGLPSSDMPSLIDIAVPDSASADSGGDDMALIAPSLSGDEAFRRWWMRATRRSVTPSVAHRINAALSRYDVRGLLEGIESPTLVTGRSESRLSGQHRYLAEHISNARLVELPGSDLLAFAGDTDLMLNEVEEFLTGQRLGAHAERRLAAVMFTDIVGSTALAAKIGDRRFKELLEHLDTRCRTEVERHGGRFIKDTGDGALLMFDQPSQAIACAVSIHQAASEIGCTVRAGIHAGEIGLRGDDVGGIAVHVAARICALSDGGETLVSGTVAELVAGSDIRFRDRGQHHLKGIDGPRPLLAVIAPD